MAQIAYVDWDGLVYYDGKIKDYIANNLEDTLKDGGQVTYAELPSPTRNNLNYVYTLTEDFTRTHELFGIEGGTYNKGTAVKITEVAPNEYLYTILYETRNPNDVEIFDDIYEQIKELKDEIDSFNPEHSDFYNKMQIDNMFAENNEELKRQDERIDELATNQYNDHLKLDQKADKSYIDKVLKDFNYDNYYTKKEIDAKFESFEDIASNVLFKDKTYKVTKAVGGFNEDDIVSNITISDMFSTMLGLEEYVGPIIPDIDSDIVNIIIENKSPMYQINQNSEYVEIPFEYKAFTDTEYEAEPTEDLFYQYNFGDSVESGYQHMSEENDSMYYVIAMLEDIDFNSNVQVKVWDKGNKSWQDVKLNMSSDMAFISQTFSESELTLPEVKEGYKLWIDSSLNTCDGATYRFIITD